MPDHALPATDALAAGPSETGLTATVQLMLFRPGVYAVALHASRPTPTDIGLELPSVRLDPLPPATASDGRAFVTGTAENGWISRRSDQVFILVAGGAARVILTTYKTAPGTPAPEIRITNVMQGSLEPATALPQPSPAKTPAPRQAAPRNAPPDSPPVRVPAPGERALRIAVQAITGTANQAFAGEWTNHQLDDRSSGWTGGPAASLEGFTVTLADGDETETGSLEYQAIMGRDWDTPWFRSGVFCGSRGLSLPLLGFRVRLSAALAISHRCSYWGRFKGGGVAGPFTDGGACSLDERELEAIRLVLEKREPGPAEPGRPTPARPTRNRKKPSMRKE